MRILHFSDFHLTHDGLGASTNIVRGITDALQRDFRDKPFDLVIFTGDMIDKGGSSFPSVEEAYSEFQNIVIDPICQALNITPDKFLIVPGNHEVNRNKVNKEEDLKLENSLKDTAAISAHLTGGRNQGYDERLKDYDDFYRQRWEGRRTYDIHTSVKLADHFVVSADGREIGISLLNTSWRCGKKLQKISIEPERKSFLKKLFNWKKKEDPKEEIVEVEEEIYNKNLLGIPQITDAIPYFKDKKIKFKIGVMHHHFALLGEPDNDDTERQLQKNYTICFCGHTHRPKSQKTEEDDEIIIASAPGVIRWNSHVEGRYRNGFAVWELDFSNDKAIEMQYKEIDGIEYKLDTSVGVQGIRTWYWDLRRHLQNFYKFFRAREEALSKDISSEDLQALIENIKKDKNDTFILFGLPGLGKTHLLHKAFLKYKEDEIFSEIVVTEIGKDVNEQLKKELKTYFSENHNKNACLIVDSTNWETFASIKKIRDEIFSNVKLIGVMNHCDAYELHRKGIPIYELNTSQTRPAIQKFLHQKFSDAQIIDQINRLSDGFPFVAMKLAEKIRQSGSADNRTALSNLTGLLDDVDRRLAENPDLLELIRTMAIFQPFPKLSNDSMNLWKSEHLSNLHNKTQAEIVNLIEEAKNLWHGEVLESTEAGYNIRPYPIALLLANDWFENHKDAENYVGLLRDIESLPEDERNIAISCLKQRLSDMNDSEAAKKLLATLTSEGSVFRNEDVVFSQMGSQLILAMSNVSPKESAEALKEVIERSSSEQIKKIHYFVRRNIVFALTNMMFYEDAFEDALDSLAILAINETENTISNNSTGIFLSAFHIFLPGTKTDLSTRIAWIKKAKSQGNKLRELPALAIKNALSVGMFLHTGHMGPKNSVEHDYRPSNEEIRSYWEECCNLAIEDIKNCNSIDIYKQCVEDNIHLWARSGMTKWVFPLIEVLAKTKDAGWTMLENEFNDIVEDLQKHDTRMVDPFEKLRVYLVSTDFFSRIKSRQKDFYSLQKNSFDPEKEIHFYDDLTSEFINCKLFDNQDLISELLTNTDYVSWAFCANLSKQISDSSLENLYNNILSNENLKDDIVSPFLSTLCSMTRNRAETKSFIKELSNKGYYSLFTKLMARTEDDDLSHLFQIQAVVPGNEHSFSLYLNQVALSAISRDKLVKYIDEHFDEIVSKDEAVYFVITHCNFEKLSPNILACCKSIVLKYTPTQKSKYVTRDLFSFVTRLLQQEADPEFAGKIHKKFMSFEYDYIDSHGLSELYKHLIQNYKDILFESILKEMSESIHKIDSAGYVLINELGTGMGFGYGYLFQLDENLLIGQLSKHGVSMARLFARMCPIFDRGDQFSHWVIRLLDEYGDDNEVRDNLGYNMGSYAWSGSVVSLHKRKIAAFTKLLNHSRSEVREWAKNRKEIETKFLNQEVKHEDLMRQLYN